MAWDEKFLSAPRKLAEPHRRLSIGLMNRKCVIRFPDKTERFIRFSRKGSTYILPIASQTVNADSHCHLKSCSFVTSPRFCARGIGS